jgi:hypothetical protein
MRSKSVREQSELKKPLGSCSRIQVDEFELTQIHLNIGTRTPPRHQHGSP